LRGEDLGLVGLAAGGLCPLLTTSR
jgi:hypothetical protein